MKQGKTRAQQAHEIKLKMYGDNVRRALGWVVTALFVAFWLYALPAVMTAPDPLAIALGMAVVLFLIRLFLSWIAAVLWPIQIPHHKSEIKKLKSWGAWQ